MGEEYPLKEITEKIIGAAFKVHNNLGEGFHEKVYENALIEELKNCRFKGGTTETTCCPLRRQTGRRFYCRYFS